MTITRDLSKIATLEARIGSEDAGAAVAAIQEIRQDLIDLIDIVKTLSADLLTAEGNVGARVPLLAGLSRTMLTSESGRTVLLDNSGSQVTLPAATGSGIRYRFVSTVVASGGGQSVRTQFGESISGTAVVFANNTGFFDQRYALTSANRITLNGGTQGGNSGDLIDIEDVATGKWMASVLAIAVGSSTASPFTFSA